MEAGVCGKEITRTRSCKTKEECDTGAKDTKAKEYLSDNRRFADLCNAVLFDGEQVISADALEERDTTEVLSVLGTDDKELQLQKWRDLLKCAVMRSIGETYIVLIGAENQAGIHYAMPVRTMLYDAINYGAQVKEAAKKHRRNRENGTGAEFLSGFHKEDRLTPVITITVYWGAEKWDAPRSLHEMFGNLNEHMKEFIPNYRVNLVVPQEMSDFSKFRTPLGAVFEIIKVSEDKQEMKRLLQEKEAYSHMDNESVAAINTFIGTNIPLNKEKGVTDMCKAWDDQKREGADEQRLVAIRNMIRYGVSKNHILQDYSEDEYERARSGQVAGIRERKDFLI